ncbi:MAG: hypothetical protein O6853_05675 [Actinobacteria bacterium]|nr:hypothetical protein [Actinomycetota bacterium]
MRDGATESFEEFKDSFAYGSRNDLSFKFLRGISSDEAGEFFTDFSKRLVSCSTAHRPIG